MEAHVNETILFFRNLLSCMTCELLLLFHNLFSSITCDDAAAEAIVVEEVEIGLMGAADTIP